MMEPLTHLSDEGQLEEVSRGTGEQVAKGGLLQYLAFRLAGEQYGINIHEIVEILKYRPATPVPHAADLIHGIVSVRGRIITVVDGRLRLGLAADPVGPASRIIVLRDGDESVGLLVDEVLQVEKFSPESISKPPSTLTDAAKRGIAGVCDIEQGSILILLDREAFLKV
jgi:purine-binding chemotaxis protein CheW